MNRTRVAAAMMLTLAVGATLVAQNNWSAWGQDAGGTKFSTLAQINTTNVATLTRAWTFHTGDTGGFFESTPLAIDGVLYFSAANGVFAIDGVTGQQIWKHPTTGTARRGPTYWPGANGVAPRLFSSTTDGLAALEPDPVYGEPRFQCVADEGIAPIRRLSENSRQGFVLLALEEAEIANAAPVRCLRQRDILGVRREQAAGASQGVGRIA